MVSVSGASDVSSAGWGGVIHSPGYVVYTAGGDFPKAFAGEHINVQGVTPCIRHCTCTVRITRRG